MTAATWDTGPPHTSPGRPWPQEEGREGPPELSPRWRGLAGEANAVVILSMDSGFKSALLLASVWVGHSISSLCASVSPFVKQGQQLSNVT